MQIKIEKIIVEALVELSDELEDESLLKASKETRLYGASSSLDSLALVSLIADIEDRISEEFEIDIVIADEKAMSAKTSPFRDVESLTNYINEQLS